MTMRVTTADGGMKELEMSIFTAREFLFHVQQSGLKGYNEEVAQMKEILSGLPTFALADMYIQLGASFDSLYAELFVRESYADDIKPLEALVGYSYEYFRATQEQIDIYVESYQRFMLLTAKAKVLSELLEERYGEEAYEENAQFAEVKEKARLLRSHLNMVVLGLGSG